jgi:hypothetical protein
MDMYYVTWRKGEGIVDNNSMFQLVLTLGLAIPRRAVYRRCGNGGRSIIRAGERGLTDVGER